IGGINVAFSDAALAVKFSSATLKDEALALAAPGYRFEYRSADYTPPAVTKYTVTFNTGEGGPSVSPLTADAGGQVAKPADPAREGFTFGGWYRDALFIQAAEFPFSLTGNTTLYAKWTENEVAKTSYGKNETATVHSIEIKFTDAKASLGDGFFITPDEGNVFVGVQFSIKNNQSDVYVISSLISFSAKMNGTALDYAWFGATLFGESLDGTVAAGQTLTGWFTVELPENWSGEFTVTFKPELLLPGSADFVVKKADVTEAPAEKTLVGITVKTPPDKISYTAGETFDDAGLVLEASYSDDSIVDIASGWTVIDGDKPLTTADTSVTITFGGETATVTITVLPPEPATVYGINETATVNSIDIKFTEVKTADGNPETLSIIVGVRFSITNNRASSVTISSLLCFEAYTKQFSGTQAADYAVFSVGLFGASLDGVIAAGQTLTGWYAVESLGYDPEWDELVITFTPDFLVAGSAVFAFKIADFMNGGEEENYTQGLGFDLIDGGMGYLARQGSATDANIIVPATYNGLPVIEFSGWSSITALTLPDSVKNISGLSTLSSSAWYHNQPDGLVYAGKVLYRYKGTVPENTVITIAPGTTGIADIAFLNLTSRHNITGVTIPDGVKRIGDSAFNNCSNLANLTVPDSVIFIGKDALSGTAWMANQPAGPVYAGKVLLGYGTTATTGVVDDIRPDTVGIGGHAFGGRSLTGVVIPASVQMIGYEAFINCKQLTSVTAAPGSQLKYIGWAAFQACELLENITLPDGIAGIDMEVFRGCKALSSIVIPSGAVYIGPLAFSGCAALASVVIPSSVTEIGNNAFSNCSSLNAVYYGGASLTAWNAIAFAGSNNAPLVAATKYYYSETYQSPGNYWRFVDGVPTPW
ncbi:MAG: leucine-rich repeat protein, partial [Firmicutes bacterium]|nr:leucine-rich repeat protein [Bacillota bacterium]